MTKENKRSNYNWNDVEKAFNDTILKKLSNKAFDSFDLIMFGAGNAGKIAFQELKKRDISLRAFSDNDSSKHGMNYLGVPCIAPQEIANFKNPLVLVAPISYFKEMSQQLNDLKLPHVFVDSLAVYLNYEQLKLIYDDYLYDEKSKSVFCALLLAKLYGNDDYCEEVYDDCFYYELPSFKFRNSADVFVDCGAFVGDTIQEFIEIRNKSGFSKIYAFEPGDRQFKALTTRTNRLKEEWALLDEQIVCVKSGLGSTTKKAYLDIENPYWLNVSTVMENGSAENEIQLVSLDEYFKDKNDKITFIKADIEGSELEMLKGAQNIIKKYKPNIALSIYHKWDDFFEIPQYIKSLVPEYNVSVRHHGYLFAETVCYCSTRPFK